MEDGRSAGSEPDDGVIRLRFTTRSLVGSVAALAVTLVLIRAFERASHTLTWVLTAVVIGLLLLPAVTALSTRLPRPLAIIIVGVVTLAALGALVLGGFDDLRTEERRAERALPRAAAQLEDSDRFSDFATAFDLEDRAQQFSEQLPERLRGGIGISGVGAATSRGAAFLVIVVLTLFTLIYAPRFFESGLAQIDDPDRRMRVEAVLRQGFRRGWLYVALHLIKAVVLGTATAFVCSAADLPAPTVLGIWVGLWSFVPDIGVIVASIPIVMLGVLTSYGTALVLLVGFATYQVVEGLVIQPRIERYTMHIGPALTFIVALVGLELYGFGGMVVAVVLAIFAIGVVDQLAPEDDTELVAGTKAVLDGVEAVATPG